MSVRWSGYIRVSCPHCRREGHLPLDWKGSQRVRCRRCRGWFYPNTDKIYYKKAGEIRNTVSVIQEISLIHQYYNTRRIPGDICDHPMYDRQLDILGEVNH
jgi:hypothetical protein